MSSLWASVKPFAPFLLTFLLPRLFNAYRTAKVAYKTRPPPRPLPYDASRAVNVLFFGVCLFFFQTLPTSGFLGNGVGVGLLKGAAQYENIFKTTNSRLKIPTDVLFTRLAMVRPNQVLTAADELLRSKITSIASRTLYLRYGPETIISCSFCSPDSPQTYLLYHLPAHVFLPHLFHLFIIGLATSGPFAGPIASTWRVRFTVISLIIAAIDTYLMLALNPTLDQNMPAPYGLFWASGLIRSITLCLFDSACAFLIYSSATNRFVLFTAPITPIADAATVARRNGQALSQMTAALQVAHTKLNAYSITRNAAVRDPMLKEADDEYWRTAVAMEGPSGGDSVWEDEEVQAAIARTLGAQARGNGNVDFEKVNMEARNFVNNITKDLEKNG